jgi:hypothetical protein
MRKSLIILAFAAGFAGTPALQAQHAMANTDSASHHMAMMMERHHSVAAIDLLVAHRDSLKLTDEQLSKLAELREHYGRQESHAMHGMGMPGMQMDHGMRIHQARKWMTFDRVPGKSVPRMRTAKPEHDPMCPMASLTSAQRHQAHELLNLGQHD